MKIIRIAEVLNRTSLSRSPIYSFCRAGTFPRQVRLGVRSVGWREADIDTWLSNRQPVERSL